MSIGSNWAVDVAEDQWMKRQLEVFRETQKDDTIEEDDMRFREWLEGRNEEANR